MLSSAFQVIILVKTQDQASEPTRPGAASLDILQVSLYLHRFKAPCVTCSTEAPDRAEPPSTAASCLFSGIPSILVTVTALVAA